MHYWSLITPNIMIDLQSHQGIEARLSDCGTRIIGTIGADKLSFKIVPEKGQGLILLATPRVPHDLPSHFSSLRQVLAAYNITTGVIKPDERTLTSQGQYNPYDLL